jgi:hypothetical protein
LKQIHKAMKNLQEIHRSYGTPKFVVNESPPLKRRAIITSILRIEKAEERQLIVTSILWSNFWKILNELNTLNYRRNVCILSRRDKRK